MMSTNNTAAMAAGTAPRITFRNLKPNQRIRFYVPNGLSLRGGMLRQEYKIVSGRVNPLLMFETHVVANYGPFGQVVDDGNFVS